jgi:hypothetical protein
MVTLAHALSQALDERSAKICCYPCGYQKLKVIRYFNNINGLHYVWP